MIAATDCVVARGAVVVNMSFGLDTDGAWNGFAEYVDRLVHATGVTVVAAVSNDCAQRMGSPEIAYNDLSVGAFADRGTTALTDDVQACDPAIGPRFSAYRDPPSLHDDREQPDLVAPGHLIRTTVPPFGFVEASGTSLAAPHVTAEVALLQDRAPFSLVGQAERVRAIVAASARHDVEGKRRLSDRDGAGAARFAAADAILRDNRSWWFTTAGGQAGFPRFESFRAAAGQTVRVALAWAQKPDADHRTIATNLQLRVLDPLGQPVRQSSTRDNNLELVAFVASQAGLYRIQVDNVRASAGREHGGLAVSLTDR
jgi:subtilisin family serine protease